MNTHLLRRLALPLFTLLLLSAAAPLRASENGGFAKPGDEIGYWTLIPFSAELAAKNTENPWPLPHQSFAFYANGEMFSHMSSHPSPQTHESLDKLHAMFPNAVHYQYNKDGFLVVTHTEQPLDKEYWGVNLISRDFTMGGTEFKAGDLLMSLDDGHGNPVYRRLLRRIP